MTAPVVASCVFLLGRERTMLSHLFRLGLFDPTGPQHYSCPAQTQAFRSPHRSVRFRLSCYDKDTGGRTPTAAGPQGQPAAASITLAEAPDSAPGSAGSLAGRAAPG